MRIKTNKICSPMNQFEKTALKNNISKFDMERFKRNQLALYLLSDKLESTSIDLISQMKSIGIYKFDDKRCIDAIRHNAGSLVKDLDKVCTEEYSCHFGDLADELGDLIDKFIADKMTLEHK